MTGKAVTSKASNVGSPSVVLHQPSMEGADALLDESAVALAGGTSASGRPNQAGPMHFNLEVQ